jgi:hypothetical protein
MRKPPPVPFGLQHGKADCKHESSPLSLLNWCRFYPVNGWSGESITPFCKKFSSLNNTRIRRECTMQQFPGRQARRPQQPLIFDAF